MIIRVVAFVLGLAATLAMCEAGQFTSTATNTTPLTVLGRVGSRAPAFVAGTAYVAGEVSTVNNRAYLALTSGTAGVTIPSGSKDVSDGTVLWRPIMSSPRETLFIQNFSVDAAYVSWHADATNVAGVKLLENGSLLLTGASCPQGRVSVIAATSGATVSVIEDSK